MFDYAQLKQFLIDHLTQDASHHRAGRYSEIGLGFDEMEANLPDGDDDALDKLFGARSFWEGWIDARNHDWQYYKHILKEDWPILAKRMVADLANDSEIGDPHVLAQFRRGSSEGAR